jgi:hypothetical protein
MSFKGHRTILLVYSLLQQNSFAGQEFATLQRLQAPNFSLKIPKKNVCKPLLS